MTPKPSERVGDLAAGTGGFLANAFEHVLEHQGDTPFTEDEWEHLQTKAFRGYDNDSGMTMLRIGSMNLILHGIREPRFFYADTLSNEFGETSEYDVLLMNPPFKGAVNKDEVHEDLPKNTTKSELLFLHVMLRALEMGGRAAVIVPDGVAVRQQQGPHRNPEKPHRTKPLGGCRQYALRRIQALRRGEYRRAHFHQGRRD